MTLQPKILQSGPTSSLTGWQPLAQLDWMIRFHEGIAQLRLVKDHLERWSEPWLLVFGSYDEPV